MSVMNETEKRLYDLIMDIKEMQARLMAVLEEREEATRSRVQRLSTLEVKVERLSHQVSGAKAWFAAVAASSSFIGWLIHHLLFNSINNPK